VWASAPTSAVQRSLKPLRVTDHRVVRSLGIVPPRSFDRGRIATTKSLSHPWKVKESVPSSASTSTACARDWDDRNSPHRASQDAWNQNRKKFSFFPCFSRTKRSPRRKKRCWLRNENETFPRFVGARARFPLGQERGGADGQRTFAPPINICKLTFRLRLTPGGPKSFTGPIQPSRTQTGSSARCLAGATVIRAAVGVGKLARAGRRVVATPTPCGEG